MENQQEIKAKIEEMEHIVRKHMTGEALTRLGIVKSAHPELGLQVMMMLYKMVQSGQLNSQVDDQTLKSLLQNIQQSRKEFNFIRK